MAKKILNPKYWGIKGWEYGMVFMSNSFQAGQKVLDVGSGGSPMAYYLASTYNVDVVTIDQKNPTEKPKFLLHDGRVEHTTGSMLSLPFKDNTFDKVLCISAIEHLDQGNYAKFLKDTKRALSEIVRVTKPNGYICITSDVYFPDMQKTDNWDGSPNGLVGTAYKRESFHDIFIKTLQKYSCVLVGPQSFDFEQILHRFDRHTYRGRYFTTFALYAKKIS